MSDRRMDLIAGYVDGTISDRDCEELLRILEADGEAVDILLDELALHRDLEFLASLSEEADREAEDRILYYVRTTIEGDAFEGRTLRKVRSRLAERDARARRRAPRVERPRARMTWRIWLPIAACLAVIVAAHIINLRQAERMPDLIMANLATVNGVVSVERDGNEISVQAGGALFFNDIVRTGTQARATVEYASEATSVDLQSATEAKFWEENGGKRIDIPAGTIECDVAPQPEDKLMVVTTPHARAEIRGTIFSLGVGPKSTRLEVTDGLVRLTRLPDGAFVDVAAGQYAVAGEGIELVVRNIAVPKPVAQRRASEERERGPKLPPPSGYVPGPIVFEDDFDEGYDNWELLVGENPTDLGPAADRLGAEYLNKVVSFRRGVDKREWIRNMGDWTVAKVRLLSLHAKSVLRVKYRTTCLRMKAPVTEEAFAVELSFMGGADGKSIIYLTPFPWARVVAEEPGYWIRSGYTTLSATTGIRWECVPAGRSEDGVRLLEMRTFTGEIGHTPDIQYWYNTTRIACEDRRVGLAVAHGAHMSVFRVAIRRMVREGEER